MILSPTASAPSPHSYHGISCRLVWYAPFLSCFLFIGCLECEIMQHARETLHFAIIHSACQRCKLWWLAKHKPEIDQKLLCGSNEVAHPQLYISIQALLLAFRTLSIFRLRLIGQPVSQCHSQPRMLKQLHFKDKVITTRITSQKQYLPLPLPSIKLTILAISVFGLNAVHELFI